MRAAVAGGVLPLLLLAFIHPVFSGARDLLTVLQQQEQPLGTALPSALQWRSCSGDIVYQPASTEDVADVVRLLYNDRSNSARTYHIRASHHNFYAHNNISCPEVRSHPTDPAGSRLTLVLDLSRMDKVLSLDVGSNGYGTVTVQSGMTFEALIEELLSHGLGLPGWLVAPPFAGMALAEVLNTAAQGSAVQGPASIATLLEAALLVDGTGQIQNLALPGPLLEGSLGLLGVATELTLKVVSARKATVWERVHEDADMARDINKLLLREETKALEVMWNPSANSFTTRVWREAEAEAPGDYVNGLFVASGAWLDKIGDMLALDQEDQTASQSVDVMCEVVGDLTNLQGYAMRHGSPRVHVAGQSRFREAIAATGYTGRLGAARCVSHALSQVPATVASAEEACLWRRAKLTPHTLTIAAKDLEAWAEDVGSVLRSTTACASFMVLMRFLGRSETLMSPSRGQATVSISLLSISSLKYNSVLPAKQQQLLDEILQRTLCKYSAQPHWGLATNRLLVGTCGAHAALGAARLERFAARRARYDPLRMFSHPMFSEQIAEGRPAAKYAGCALSGDCFCEQDVHCGPGFGCVPGLVFPEYKVCRMWGNENVGSLMDEL